MHNLSCENEFYLHENKQSFPYQRLSTYPSFDAEARRKAEMALLLLCLTWYGTSMLRSTRVWTVSPACIAGSGANPMRLRVFKCSPLTSYGIQVITFLENLTLRSLFLKVPTRASLWPWLNLHIKDINPYSEGHYTFLGNCPPTPPLSQH